MSGIERRIDKLGRIVLPMSYRKKLGLSESSTVSIILYNDVISITKSDKRCIMCNRSSDINSALKLCSTCIEKVKREG